MDLDLAASTRSRSARDLGGEAAARDVALEAASASISEPCPRSAAARAPRRIAHQTGPSRSSLRSASAVSSSTPRRASALSVRRVIQPALRSLAASWLTAGCVWPIAAAISVTVAGPFTCR